MGEILPDGSIQGYFAPCPKCGGDMEVNFQGTSIGIHKCRKIKTFILRQESDNIEDDKYYYWISTIKSGIELITPFREKATRIKENEFICEVSRKWTFIEVKE